MARKCQKAPFHQRLPYGVVGSVFDAPLTLLANATSDTTWARSRHSHPHKAASGRMQSRIPARQGVERSPPTRMYAGQRAFLLVFAEGVGFEPTETLARFSGFQDRGGSTDLAAPSCANGRHPFPRLAVIPRA